MLLVTHSYIKYNILLFNVQTLACIVSTYFQEAYIKLTCKEKQKYIQRLMRMYTCFMMSYTYNQCVDKVSLPQ